MDRGTSLDALAAGRDRALDAARALAMVAGFAAGIPCWHRHRDRGGGAGGWVARRAWRLLWPTLPSVAFWTVLTQIGDHVFHVDDSLLAATRGIGVAITGLHVRAFPAALPVVQLVALAGAAIVLVRPTAGRRAEVPVG